MKPIVIDVNCMTFQGIKDAIEEAYNAGYKDGHDDGYEGGRRSMQLAWNGNPVPTTTPNHPWWNEYKYEVTCSNSKDTE